LVIHLTLIIGFGHKARHGKDEAVKALVSLCGCPTPCIRRYGFADALKREVADAAVRYGECSMEKLIDAFRGATAEFKKVVFDLPDWVKYEPDADMDDPLCPYGKQRTLLQFWGTEFRRAQDPDYWVKKTLAQIELDNPEVALIGDLRFPNEVEGIRAAGGYVVRVDRVGYVSDVPEHISEKALDGMSEMDWDYVIKAPDGGLQVLCEEAVNALNFLGAVNDSHRE